MTTTTARRPSVGEIRRVQAPGTAWHDLVVRVDGPGPTHVCTTPAGERFRIPHRLLTPTDLDALPPAPVAAYAAGDVVLARLPEAFGFAPGRAFVVTGVDPAASDGRSVGLAPLLPVGGERGKTFKVGPRILSPYS